MKRPLYAYAYAEVAFDDAIALLAEDPRGVLQSATDASMQHADEVVTHLHVEVAGFDLSRGVVVELGAFQPVEALRCVLPVSWRAASGHLLFPTVAATLVGHVVDRALTHRMAEAVVHRFVEDVVRRLESMVTSVSTAQRVTVPMSSTLEVADVPVSPT